MQAVLVRFCRANEEADGRAKQSAESDALFVWANVVDFVKCSLDCIMLYAIMSSQAQSVFVS